MTRRVRLLPEIQREVEARWGRAGAYWEDGDAFYVGYRDRRGRSVVVGGSRYSFVDALMDADRHPSAQAPRPNPGIDWSKAKRVGPRHFDPSQSAAWIRPSGAMYDAAEFGGESHPTFASAITGIDDGRRAMHELMSSGALRFSSYDDAVGVSFEKKPTREQVAAVRQLERIVGSIAPTVWEEVQWSDRAGDFWVVRGGSGHPMPNPPRWLCAYCRRWFGEDKVPRGVAQPKSIDKIDSGISHGMCAECAALDLDELDAMARKQQPNPRRR